jgi:predicted PurR-regulated permease PerM
MMLGQWLGVLAVILSLYILWQIRQMLSLVFAAIVAATLLNRLAHNLQRRFRWPRPLGVIGALAIFFTILVSFGVAIFPPFVSQFQELISTKLPAIVKYATDWRTHLQAYVPPALIPYLPDLNNLDKQLQPLLASLAGRSLAIFSNSLAAILNLLFVVILTIMFLAQPDSYRRVFIALFPSFYRRRVSGILTECEESLSKWFGGAILSMIVVAALSFIGLIALGIPLALAQAILAGLLNFIPNVGPTLSVVIPMSIALLDEPWKAVAIFFIYLAIQQFESNFLTPYIMSQQVSLLPAITLIAQIFFTTFFGFLGLLLALPLTVVGKVWINAVLIEDVLDRWKYSRHGDKDPNRDPETETEIVLTDRKSGVESSDKRTDE